MDRRVFLEKAKDLVREAGLETPSSGFIEMWKNDIVFKRSHGEAGDADEETVIQWIQQNAAKINSFSLKDCHNKDETGLFYRAMLNGTLTFKTDKVKEGKSRKETNPTEIVVCTNADGTNKSLLIIGKSTNPRASENSKPSFHIRLLLRLG